MCVLLFLLSLLEAGHSCMRVKNMSQIYRSASVACSYGGTLYKTEIFGCKIVDFTTLSLSYRAYINTSNDTHFSAF